MNKGRIKEIGIKARTYYFFDDMIYIKSLDLNKIKIEETESVKPLHLIINKVNG